MIKVLQTDNGGEYVNHEIHNIFHEVGIQLQHIVPYTQQQNRVAEQKNRSLKEMESCMHMQSHYHRDYGPKHLIVKHTSKTNLPIDMSRIRPPYEAWSGLKPEVAHFCIFGSCAWARIPSEKRKALDP